MFMIMFVLDDPRKLDQVLETWEKAGITGVTIIDSTGFQRHRKKKSHIPMRYSLQPVVLEGEEGNLTLLTIVNSEALVDEALRAVEGVVGDLDDPETGVLAAWPLMRVKGVPGAMDTQD